MRSRVEMPHGSFMARSKLVCLFAVALALLAVRAPAAADLVEKSGRFGGLELRYKVLLPPGYDAGREYPLVLVFTGGPQDLRMAESTIDTDWRAEAERRGYIIVSPGTPNGERFFQGADVVFPEFLDALLRDYRVAGGKLHVAGHSNGGLSAFHVAVRYPGYFATVTGYPGLLGDLRDSTVAAVRELCVFMHVGSEDASWLQAMRSQAEMLQENGFRVAFSVEEGQIHRLRAAEIDLSRRLFDEIESCR